MEIIVHSDSESSAHLVSPATATLEHDSWTWLVCGALFCLLLIARLTGVMPTTNASAGAEPAGAVVVPATLPPAPVAHHPSLPRI